MTKSRGLLAGALALAVAFPALAQDEPSAETVLATVNGVDITLGHVIVMRARLPEQYQSMPDDVLYAGLLDQLIQQTALSGGLDGQLSRGAELALENERRAFLAGEALNALADAAVTEDAIAGLYAERFTGAEPSEEYNAAHILVATEEEAAAIKAELDGGADFGELARTRSTGPSGPNAGDLGWFGKGMMVEPFETAVLALSPGEVSGPVETQFGWHIIRLNEVRMKEAPPLEAVRDEIATELKRTAIDAAIAQATEEAEVVRNDEGLDPAVIRNFELVAD